MNPFRKATTKDCRTTPAVAWPDNKRFAFTVFDDTDGSTVENVAPVYDFLADCGFRTTKSCWVSDGDAAKGSCTGHTCDDANYLQWLLQLQSRGFEIGWHGATWHGSPRDMTLQGLDKFAKLFGHFPYAAANHSKNDEAMYWGEHRLTGVYARLYNLATRNRHRGRFRGHIESDLHFWGDLCKKHIKYFRNFVFQDINTLKCCPLMPYHDSRRPLVNYWFASSNGAEITAYLKCLSERNQDRLEREGGACIMYTHFASGFTEGKSLSPQFVGLMKRLADKGGWFVPVHTLLDYLQKVQGDCRISDAQRRRLEGKWFFEKLRVGSN